ncbi:TenA family protein [Phormidium sp. CCY1219]|uniref:TenA family protein n=1 Tax=Phormidium sp. CCY1219 TaxID=2886104 RepID=UPI002D1F8900|nr:TenA family protein [Phormidium sp. CCY1219]MEB3828036.1 TenA family protein [Phormidium sp. CCY1219]
MTLSNKLWQANRDLAQECIEHPFVQGIARGNLPRHQFAYYVGQDAFFLEAFARAYSIAAAKTPDWESFEVFHRLGSGVLSEIHLHQGYAKQWNIDFQAVKPGVATRRYTDFLLATAWSQSVGLTAVAMAPCMRLYAFLGQQLAANGIGDRQYADWIHTYSDEQFEQLARQLEQLVDRYAASTPMAHSTYRYAMLCERDFFQAACEVQDG